MVTLGSPKRIRVRLAIFPRTFFGLRIGAEGHPGFDPTGCLQFDGETQQEGTGRRWAAAGSSLLCAQEALKGVP